MKQGLTAFTYQPKRRGKKSPIHHCYIRLPSWPKRRRFLLGIKDARVAEQKMWELVARLEREEAGIAIPKPLLDGAEKALSALLEEFLAELKAEGRTPNTLTKYRGEITRLCKRCGWRKLSDVTEASYVAWRTKVQS